MGVPLDIWRYILCLLDFQSVENCAFVCKRFNKLTRSNLFWIQKIKHLTKEDPELVSKIYFRFYHREWMPIAYHMTLAYFGVVTPENKRYFDSEYVTLYSIKHDAVELLKEEAADFNYLLLSAYYLSWNCIRHFWRHCTSMFPLQYLYDKIGEQEFRKHILIPEFSCKDIILRKLINETFKTRIHESYINTICEKFAKREIATIDQKWYAELLKGDSTKPSIKLILALIYNRNLVLKQRDGENLVFLIGDKEFKTFDYLLSDKYSFVLYHLIIQMKRTDLLPCIDDHNSALIHCSIDSPFVTELLDTDKPIDCDFRILEVWQQTHTLKPITRMEKALFTLQVDPLKIIIETLELAVRKRSVIDISDIKPDGSGITITKNNEDLQTYSKLPDPIYSDNKRAWNFVIKVLATKVPQYIYARNKLGQ